MNKSNLQENKNKKKYKLILFDFDGTIADILPHIVPFFNQFSKEYNFLPITNPDYTRSLTLNQIIKEHKISLFKIPILLKKVQKLQMERMDEILLYKGLDKMIPKLSEKYELAILSSNSKTVINTFLEKNNLSKYFSFVISFPRLFYKSVPLARILITKNLKSSSVLYVGDEVRDIQATKMVHIDCASVTWGINSKELLKKYNPKYIVNSPKELLNLLD